MRKRNKLKICENQINTYIVDCNFLPMILGLVGKMGGFEAVPGLGVETCRCLLELLLLLFAMVELLLLSGSPKLFLFGRPGQFISMKGSLIGTLEL